MIYCTDGEAAGFEKGLTSGTAASPRPRRQNVKFPVTPRVRGRNVVLLTRLELPTA